MAKYVVITARVPKDLRDKAKELGINLSEFVREALRKEIEKRILERIKERRKKLENTFKKMPEERVVKSIREMRESR